MAAETIKVTCTVCGELATGLTSAEAVQLSEDHVEFSPPSPQHKVIRLRD